MYKFIYEDDVESGSYPQFPKYIQMDFSSNVTWDDLLQGFMQFLKGSGFEFPINAEVCVIDTETGEDLGLQCRIFKAEYLKDEAEDEDTTS